MADERTLKRILIFDDDADLRKLLLVYLGKLFPGVKLEEYDPLSSGVPGEEFDWSRVDVLILDYFLCIQGVTGLDILHVNRKNPDFPATVMLTGAGNEEVAVRALKAGVYDYLRKQSLDKQELHDSIVKAFNSHNESVRRKRESTEQGKAFNKSLFYQQLEFHKDIPGYRGRVLLYIELDEYEQLAQREGVILRDNIVRHIAKNSFEIFSIGGSNPSITRLSDACTALLIDMPDSRKPLEYNLNGLLNHLKKRPFKFDERKIDFSVSVGVVALSGDGESRDSILKKARAACKTAAQSGGYSYFIYSPETIKTKEPLSPQPTDTEERKEAVPSIDEAEPPSPPVKPPGSKPAGEKVSEKPSTTPAKAETGPVKVVRNEAPQKPPPAPPPRPVTPAAKPVPAPAKASEPAARPKKSLEELKAELEKSRTMVKDEGKDIAGNAVRSDARKTSPVEEITLNDSELDENGRNLKNAFDEKRVIQVYQPVISLLNEEMDSDDEMHYVSLQLVDNDGKTRVEDEFRKDVKAPVFQKFIDRWVLREVIGFLTTKNRSTYTFILKLSAASLADASFFNWLRKLLTGLDSRNPGKYIALEIDAGDLSSLEKQANALMSYLRKSHDFKFVLGHLSSSADIIQYTQKMHFDLIRCNRSLISELQGISAKTPQNEPGKEKSTHSQLDLIKSRSSRFIADDIVDATTLTECISIGTDYAMGVFIGEPVTQLDDMTNIESFEIV